MNNQTKLYCYSKPNVMEGHRYSDDVAICYADSLKDAMSKFLRCYDLSLLAGNVKEVKFNDFGIFIATDYQKVLFFGLLGKRMTAIKLLMAMR